MNLVDSLLNFLRKKDTPEAQETPEGLCPNCWGRNEYGGQFFETVINENLDINSKDSNVGWIQAYANKNLSGIALKKIDNQVVCSQCKVGYKKI